MMDAMSEVTQILSRIDLGDPSAADQLLPLVYEELRRLAAAKLNHEKPGQTLQATALVHEAYLRLVGKSGSPEAFRETDGRQTQSSGSHWNSRGHFFAAAAEAMRRILIEHARKKHAEKRGGSRQRMEFTDAVAPEALPPLELLALNEAMEQLARDYPQHAALVKLRFFGGLTLEDAASTLGISVATAKRRWTWARAWLFGRLATPAGQPEIA
ncbi:RNA polymerase sigma factor SigL [Lacipirellula limnantheis]|uniref:RNA polymerase sigma factor SigL n=2 Tax=Lacipirellula limnantheis TaxID=2528024 RepID=A0A517TYI8_9BACT|nr:RNA polymerase sigma factor SigL [Lacipirellula limnantheis]